ncbi:hypothetical protein ACFOVU_21625 [Nocardiopsis sediminis]|uniref:WD40 repeat domain-containing protein n=1 Tax=Nocardiopsis sediminis TaxID=1778267 RepID=A0ABV8FR23_9ACTN
MRTGTVIALSSALAVLPAVPAAAEPSPSTDPGPALPEGSEVRFHIEDPRILESSGMAASRLHDGVYWTHNDSGDYGPVLYAVDETGATVATITLTGAGVEARDWEAVSVGTDDNGAPAVYVGDIGDNFQGGWPSVRVYRFTEPDVLTDATVDATTYTFTYEDGGRDAEAMMVDPDDGRLYIISKEVAGGVYAAPAELDPEGTNTLTRIDSAPLFATDAAFAPDGRHYAIRTYWSATVYDAADGVPGRGVDRLNLPDLDQGESMTFSHDGSALMVGTEGERSPVWRIPLPDTVAAGEDGGDGDGSAAEPGADTGDGAGADDDAAATGGGPSPLLWTGVGLAVVLIAGIALLVRAA